MKKRLEGIIFYTENSPFAALFLPKFTNFGNTLTRLGHDVRMWLCYRMLQEPLQKVPFRAAKDGFSACDLWPFTTQKAAFWKTAPRRHLSDRTYGRIRDE